MIGRGKGCTYSWLFHLGFFAGGPAWVVADGLFLLVGASGYRSAKGLGVGVPTPLANLDRLSVGDSFEESMVPDVRGLGVGVSTSAVDLDTVSVDRILEEPPVEAMTLLTFASSLLASEVGGLDTLVVEVAPSEVVFVDSTTSFGSESFCVEI